MAADNVLTIDCSSEGNVLRVTPRGEVDLSTSPKLRQALQAALAEGEQPVEIILSEVPYMDSSGVATLVGRSAADVSQAESGSDAGPPITPGRLHLQDFQTGHGLHDS